MAHAARVSFNLPYKSNQKHADCVFWFTSSRGFQGVHWIYVLIHQNYSSIENVNHTFTMCFLIAVCSSALSWVTRETEAQRPCGFEG